MSRLQEISKALASINETVFQELCDSYLLLRNKNYSAFSRIGSHSFRQKTTIGTPDSLILLPNGKYIFVEYSTNRTKGVKKIKEDIEKCINTEKTGIGISEIAEIIICINFNLNGKQIEEIKSIVKHTRITLTIVMLDELALQLNLHHRDLSHQYLGLHFDTGQVVSIDTFINEYNKSAHGIATPLDNTFVHRENELALLTQTLNHSDFIILTGPAGVGKTRLALESIHFFLKENIEYRAYCISYKSYNLLDDLYHYLQPDENNVLFVDDANRIDSLNQILGFYRSIRTGRLKIIITVRDYAYEEIYNLAYAFNPTRIEVSKFNDEQITDIIKAKPYEILNAEYQKEILRIADGNPRLGIMASLLAKAHQNLDVLSDVSNLFESYFTTLVKDSVEFAKKNNLQFLGLISFFYTIPYKDKILVEDLLSKFNLNYNDFIDAISKLEQLELVELQYEYVKISEQNLSTYFFYRCFIKDKLLSFERLVIEFFHTNESRFKDSVIAANNTFGPNNVMNELRPALSHFFHQSSIENKEKILRTFWYYLPQETLDYVFQEINALPKQKHIDFVLKYDSNKDYLYLKNNFLELLSNFFWDINYLKDALGLAFDYVERVPQHCPELIKTIKEYLTFDRDDEYTGYERQTTLFNELILGLKKNNKLRTESFFELSGFFMHFQFRHTKGGRKNTILLYEYRLPPSPEIKKIRERIWREIDMHFLKYPELCLQFLTTFIYPGSEVNAEILDDDLTQLLLIINKHLLPANFHHCVIVNKLKDLAIENNLNNPNGSELKNLAKKFTNDIYILSKKLDWNKYRSKDSFEFSNYEEFERLKESEIRVFFKFETNEQVEKFYNSYEFLHKNVSENWTFNKALDIIIDENYTSNLNIGLTLLKLVIRGGNQINYIPWLLFKNNLNKIENKEKLWKLCDSGNFAQCSQWKLSFFQFLDENLITTSDCKRLIDAYRENDESITIFLDNFKKYKNCCPDIFNQLLKVVYLKNKSETTTLKIWQTDFNKYFDTFDSDLDLLFDVFLQHERLKEYYDYDGEILRKFVVLDRGYLLKFIVAVIDEDKRFSQNSPRLNFVWELQDIDSSIKEAIDYLIDNHIFYGIREHPANSFFYNLKEKEGERADRFLLNYLSENYAAEKYMNTIVDIVRHSRKNLFNEILLRYITLTQDVSFFEKVWWRGNGGSYTGNVIIGDIQAAEWRNILSIVETSDVGIQLIPIKKYIHSQIEYCLNRADSERKRRFLERDY